MAERPKNTIRTKVMCLFVHDGKVLAGKGTDKLKNGHFYRVLGGSLTFGEPTEDGIRREIREELHSEIENLHFIEAFENLYVFEGQQGHDIIFLFQGDLSEKKLYQQNPVHIIESDYEVWAEWISINDILEKKVILYPEWDYQKYFSQIQN